MSGASMKTMRSFAGIREQTKRKRAVIHGPWVMIAIAASTVLCAQTKGQAVNAVGNNAPDGKILIVPWESVGQVRRGMTTNEVISVLGLPEKMQGKLMVYAKRLGITVAPAKSGVAAVFCGDSSG